MGEPAGEIEIASPRDASLDATRAALLLGVFTMNYVVEWNLREIQLQGWQRIAGPRWLVRVIDPWTGPFSTRFAATLVMLVGVGVALLTRRSVVSGDRTAISTDRWRLRRRGLLFVLVGVFFDVVWPGEILHFVGLYLMCASWVITWPQRRLLGLAGLIAAVTAVQRVLVFNAVEPSEWTSWWAGVDPATRRRSIGYPRGFLSNVVSWGAHPLLPWLAFVFVGMAIGRSNWLRERRSRLVAVGLSCLAAGYGVGLVGRQLLPERWDWVASNHPGGFGYRPPFGLGMPAYVLGTAGSSIVAMTALVWLFERTRGWLPTRVLARAGQVTFTLYLAHGLIPWLLTSHGWVGNRFGLIPSIWIAVGSWIAAMLAGAIIHKWLGTAPMEWLLRQIGGPAPQPTLRSAVRAAPESATAP